MNKWLVGVLITGTLMVPLLFSWNALEIIKLKTFESTSGLRFKLVFPIAISVLT